MHVVIGYIAVAILMLVIYFYLIKYLFKSGVSLSKKNPDVPVFAFISGVLLGPLSTIVFPLRKNAFARILYLYPMLISSFFVFAVVVVMSFKYLTICFS